MKPVLQICCLILFTFIISTGTLADEIKLLFPKYQLDKTEKGKAVYSLAKKEGKQEYSEEDLKRFVQKFEGQGYRIDQIELWVEGKAESGGITKFIVSVEGGGGIKIILRPKD